MIQTAIRRGAVIWSDGAFYDERDVPVHPLTHALHYGSGVFEGILVYGTPRGSAIFRLQDQVDRLFASAAAYGMQIRHDRELVAQAIIETVRANDLSYGYIRPLAYFAHDRANAKAALCDARARRRAALQGSLVGENSGGCRATISPWRKTPSQSLPAGVKACGHYTNSILALQDARDRRFEEAILLNHRGHVAEATCENVFIVAGGAIVTNDASADVLEGITRDTVLRIASDCGIPARIEPIAVRDLLRAQEVFLVGTAAEIVPVARIDHSVFDAPGAITARIAQAYLRAVAGREPRYEPWLTYV